MPNSSDAPSLAGAAWLTQPETRAVLAALERGGYPARVVGGAVRNALLGRPVKDIDIATPMLPEDTISVAEQAGLKTIPTGLQHGTVTVIANHTPFEVTTLRRDEETFGRHARVAFTSDWAEDAARRDFTINALYCDAAGVIYDPLGGLADIAEPCIRFINSAKDRIKEDYLRILRFFRFTAEYTNGVPDPDGLAACTALQSGLAKISAERIRSELLRLLAAPAAEPVLAAMATAGLLSNVLGGTADLERFSRLVAIEAALARPGDETLRLGALAVARPGDALRLRDTMRLSNTEYERLSRMVLPDHGYDPGQAELKAKAALYRHGAEAFRDGLLLAWANARDVRADDIGFRERLRLIERWPAPELPVRGQDVMALGVPAGPAVGAILSHFEEWWIAEGFPSDADRLARELQRIAMVTKA
jgi:poly(A) polymerase